MLNDQNNNVILKLGDLYGIREEENDASDLTSLPIHITNRLHLFGKHIAFGNEINKMKTDFEHVAIDKYPKRMGGNTNDHTDVFISWIENVLKEDYHKEGYMHKDADDEVWKEGLGEIFIRLLKILKAICRFGRTVSRIAEIQASKDSTDLENLHKLNDFLIQHPYSTNNSTEESLYQTTQSVKLVNSSPRLILEAISSSNFTLDKFTTNVLESVNKILQNRTDLYKHNLNKNSLSDDLALPSIQAQLKAVLNVDQNKELHFII